MGSRTSMIKRFGFAVAGLVMILALAACGGGGDSDSEGSGGSEGSDGDVKLTLWAWPGFGLQDLVDQYEDENPEISIEIQEADYADVHENLITALASGSGAPDISAVDEGYMERMKENSDHFYNLYDLGAGDLEDDYLDWKWEQATDIENDFLIGIPTDVGPMVMAYREDIFEEAGLPTDPAEVAEEIDTWEKYIEAGRQVEEETGVKMINRTVDLYNAVLDQGQIQFFDEDENFVAEESEQSLRAWELSAEAVDISKNVERDSTEWGAALAAGDIATVLLPPWMMQNVQNAAPDTAGQWNITFMPEGSGNFGGSFLTLPKQGEHSEEAYDFITWVMAPEQQLEIFKENGPFPSTPEVYDDPAIEDLESDFFNNPNLGTYYAEAAEQVVAGHKGVMHDPIKTLFEDALISIEDGNSTPEEAWDNAIKEAERQLSRQ